VCNTARIASSLSGYCSLMTLTCLTQTSRAHSNVRDMMSVGMPWSHSSFPAVVLRWLFDQLFRWCKQGPHAHARCRISAMYANVRRT
jgi:hypothetical protein